MKTRSNGERTLECVGLVLALLLFPLSAAALAAGENWATKRASELLWVTLLTSGLGLTYLIPRLASVWRQRNVSP